MSNVFAHGWYAVLPTNLIKDKPIPIKCFGVNLVIWRNQATQKVNVMQDLCPHRSAKLSLGKVCGDNIVCPFHGFRFADDGKCSYAPEFDKAIPGIQVKTFKSLTAVDMLWVFWGEYNNDLLQIEPLEAIHNEFRGQYSKFEKTWNSHITRCIENQLDYTHLPHVHRTTIGKNFKILKDPKFTKTENKITIYDQRNKTALFLEYLFPNAWILNIGDKMKLVFYFVPIDINQTKFIIFTYRKFLVLPIIKPLMDILFNYVNKIILNQDRKVVESQGESSSIDAKAEYLMRHDTAIRMFRSIWQDNI